MSSDGSLLGLYDFGARYYDPLLGRWFNPDPVLQTTNPYIFCGNNPAMNVDKDGKFFFSLIVPWFKMLIASINGDWQAMTAAGQQMAAGAKGLIMAPFANLAGMGVSAALSNLGILGTSVLAESLARSATTFVASSSVGWLSGASFSEGLRMGASSAAYSILGSLVSGSINCVATGNSFWGTTDEVVTGMPGQQRMKDIDNDALDKILNEKAGAKFGVKAGPGREGTYGLQKMTTRPNGKYEVTKEGMYRNTENGNIVGGYTERSNDGTSVAHIAPAVVAGNDVTFHALVGHELIHIFHNNTLTTGYKKIYSEPVAYEFSIKTFRKAGMRGMARQMRRSRRGEGFSRKTSDPRFNYHPFSTIIQ